MSEQIENPVVADEAKLSELETKLRLTVSHDLLRLALTHPSAVGEGEARTLFSNQRLEFLGDAVVGAVVAEHLYRSAPNLPEGVLTQRKAAAVQKASLATAARRMDLGSYLILGRGEANAGGQKRDTILCDALEALIGAIYLAAGWERAQQFVLETLAQELAVVEHNAGNVKNELQEWTQAQGLGTPSYVTEVTGGPAHERRFSSSVLLQGEVRGRGSGKSKKEAECRAAQAALEFFGSSDANLGKY